MQVILGETESQIKVYLESNTILPGTYVNAEYNIPEDYRIQQLEKIADKLTILPSKNLLLELILFECPL